jgi:hypothetical protein
MTLLEVVVDGAEAGAFMSSAGATIFYFHFSSQKHFADVGVIEATKIADCKVNRHGFKSASRSKG